MKILKRTVCKIIRSAAAAALCVLVLSGAACTSGNVSDREAAAHTSPAAAGNTPGGESTVNTPEPTQNVPEGAVKWINAHGNSDAVIMTHDQIAYMNEKMRERCAALTDIKEYEPNISRDQMTHIIESSSGPSLPKYDEKGVEITEAELEAVRANRNLDALADLNTAVKGVTVQRTDIRALPTDREFYNSASVQDYDRMQESELPAASAVWILHTSLDGKYHFIQSYYYIGWVRTENVAVAEGSGDWDMYADLLNIDGSAFDRNDFAVITDSQVNVNGVRLDMGTAVPLDGAVDAAASGSVILPGRDADGKLTRVNAELPKGSYSIGYPDYTLRSFYIQAFKYVGTPYGWGGMKNGVDCSSYVLSVFKSFGFVFPRNTSQQNSTVGRVTDVEGQDDAYKISVLSEAYENGIPTLIYKSGHVMIYLGVQDGVHYIIHAPGSGRVREDAYDGFSSLIRICEVSPLK